VDHFPHIDCKETTSPWHLRGMTWGDRYWGGEVEQIPELMVKTKDTHPVIPGPGKIPVYIQWICQKWSTTPPSATMVLAGTKCLCHTRWMSGKCSTTPPWMLGSTSLPERPRSRSRFASRSCIAAWMDRDRDVCGVANLATLLPVMDLLRHEPTTAKKSHIFSLWACTARRNLLSCSYS
jgi:hypothetical protein